MGELRGGGEDGLGLGAGEDERLRGEGGLLERFGYDEGEVLAGVEDGVVAEGRAALGGEIVGELGGEGVELGAVGWGEDVEDAGERFGWRRRRRRGGLFEIVPLAMVDWTRTAWARLGRVWSAVNLRVPRTLSRPSTRGDGGAYSGGVLLGITHTLMRCAGACGV